MECRKDSFWGFEGLRVQPKELRVGVSAMAVNNDFPGSFFWEDENPTVDFKDLNWAITSRPGF